MEKLKMSVSVHDAKRSKGGRGEKVVRVFASVADVTRYFGRNPDRLVEYVRTGLARRTSIMGVHIAQLAREVGMPLIYNGRTYDTLPGWAWVDPNNFKNINLILLKADGAGIGR